MRTYASVTIADTLGSVFGPLSLAIVLAALFAVAVVAGLLWVFFQKRQDRPRLVASLAGLATVGMVAGLVAGLSREGAVGAVVPAVLTLLGGVGVHLFAVDSTRGALVPLGAAVVALPLLFGFLAGAQVRDGSDVINSPRDACARALGSPEVWLDDPVPNSQLLLPQAVLQIYQQCDALWRIEYVPATIERA